MMGCILQTGIGIEESGSTSMEKTDLGLFGRPNKAKRRGKHFLLGSTTQVVSIRFRLKVSEGIMVYHRLAERE